MAFVNEKENQRTIDYDRNAYLVHTVTKTIEGKNYAVFELYWGENKIVISADDNTIVKNDMRYVEWDVQRIYCDPTLLIKSDQILKMINEAMNVYGYMYTHDKVKELKVIFNEKLKWQSINEA